jgi:hypothetical protein
MEITKELLNFDPLRAAEDFTGKSYKTDEETSSIGFFAHMMHSRAKNEILDQCGDTIYGCGLEKYISIAESIGFKEVLKVPFTYDDYGTEKTDCLFFFWHEDGILLTFDTYSNMKNCNGGHFYYNWSPNDKSTITEFTSSGSFISHGKGREMKDLLWNKDLTPHIMPESIENEPLWCGDLEWMHFESQMNKYREAFNKYVSENEIIYIWAGDHDCREALRFKIEGMKNNGTFLKTWKEQPFLWLLHHQDTEDKNYDYKKINQERIALLPVEVQECIKGTE